MTGRAKRPYWMRVGLLICAAALVVCFVQLGNWQIRRLAWKTDLIATVNANAFGDPVALPEGFDADAHTFLRVTAVGTPLPGDLRVKAVTELGPGHWVMRPYETAQGLLWVNQGFVPSGWTGTPRSLPAAITGLLRPTVPGGTLLERNDPAVNRWVSRDTAAMSDHLNLGPALPYFLDAEQTNPAGDWPQGGMTIVTFRNTHLSYALTWYAMAILLAFGVLWLGRNILRDDDV